MIVPVRNTADVASSRLAAGDHLKVGNCSSASEVEAYLNKHLTSLLVDAVLSDIQLTFLAFPTFLENPTYTYRKLQGLFERYGVDIDTYVKAHQDRYKPEWVHQ